MENGDDGERTGDRTGVGDDDVGPLDGDAAAAAGGGIGAAVTRRIMASLKIPDDEYAMVCTANRTTAFRLLAES